MCFSLAPTEGLELPAFSHKQSISQEAASLRAVALAVVEHLAHGGQIQGLAAHCQALALHQNVRMALDQVVALGISDGQAVLLLAHWTNVRTDGLGSAPITAALQPHLDALPTSLVDACGKLFERLLGGYSVDDWTLSRTRRLRRAVERVIR